MTISASIKNKYNQHDVVVSTNNNQKTIIFLAKQMIMVHRLMVGKFCFLHWLHVFAMIFIAKPQKEI